MRAISSILLILLYSIQGSAQSERLVVYDLVLSQVVDTTGSIPFDNEVIQSKTTFDFGDLYTTSPVNIDFPPESSLFEESLFSHRIAAAKLFNIEGFPLRATPKLMKMVDGTLEHSCSSTMIAGQYILTSAHCFFNQSEGWFLSDSIFVFPSYNSGQPNVNLPSTMIEKVYIPLSYINEDNFRNDIAICKLKEPIGIETGWLGIGFHKEDSFFEGRIFQKSAFPIETFAGPAVSPDTMYYAYGQVEVLDTMRLMVPDYVTAWGETGSSLYYTNNVNDYTAYGVAMNTANYFKHVRIIPSVYYSIIDLIQADVVTSVEEPNILNQSISVSPNPTSKSLKVEFTSIELPVDYEIYSTQMKLIAKGKIFQTGKEIEVERYPSGVYVLVVNGTDFQEVIKFVKQ